MSDALARALIAVGDSTEVTILVKATLIMMVGLGATQLAARARASVRHVLLASTFAAVLLLPVAGRRVLHHGGSLDGGRAMLMMFPDSKVVVAMLANLCTDFGERDAQELGALFIP